MKTLIVIISSIIAVNALTDYEQWISFKNKYKRTYKSLKEESHRLKIFKENLKRIETHNAKYHQGEETYWLGINQFADFTEEELHKKHSFHDFQLDQPTAKFSAKPNVRGAKSVDWREKGVVFEAGKEDACGSGWAFSVTGSLEGINAIKHNQKKRLSVQELIDCTFSYGNYGCHGGNTYNGFKYIHDHGISAFTDYPYAYHDETCRNTTFKRVDVKMTGYTLLDVDEEALRQAVETIGPISTTICDHYDIWVYAGGIFDPKYNCCKNTNEATLTVGYGTENGKDYWIVRLSYGTEWGENGYLRIVRKKNNTCGVCSLSTYPIVV